MLTGDMASYPPWSGTYNKARWWDVKLYPNKSWSSWKLLNIRCSFLFLSVVLFDTFQICCRNIFTSDDDEHWLWITANMTFLLVCFQVNGQLPTSKEDTPPMVAFLCGKPAMHLTPKGWIRDESTDCIDDAAAILDYCKKVSWIFIFITTVFNSH